MLIKTRGIIFRALKYSETSLILDIYTEEKGLRNYIISGVRNKKSKLKTGLLQPTMLVEMVAYDKAGGGLSRIKEIKAAQIYQSIPFELMKGTISLFMIELAQKTIKEEEANPGLFNFLFQQFSDLDRLEKISPNFHIYYMIELSSFLGFFPGGSWSEATPWLDMREGSFTKEEPLSQYSLNKEMSEQVGRLVKQEIVQLTRVDRQKIVGKLIDYYRIHVEGFAGLNTHAILKEVLEG